MKKELLILLLFISIKSFSQEFFVFEPLDNTKPVFLKLSEGNKVITKPYTSYIINKKFYEIFEETRKKLLKLEEKEIKMQLIAARLSKNVSNLENISNDITEDAVKLLELNNESVSEIKIIEQNNKVIETANNNATITNKEIQDIVTNIKNKNRKKSIISGLSGIVLGALTVIAIQ